MKNFKLPLALSVGIWAVAGCGQKQSQQKGHVLERGVLPGAPASANTDSNAQALGSVSFPIPAIPPVNCSKPRTNQGKVAAMTQDLYGRPPTAEELAQADAAAFDYDKFVDQALENSSARNGYTRFINNLFKVDRIIPNIEDDEDDPAVITLATQQAEHLKLEPSTLLLNNLNKEWSWFWNTREFFCTDTTAQLYNLSVVKSNGFISCTLPEDRAGFMGLVSVLRATSPKDDPTALFMVNNNYQRVAALLYFEEGMQLLANTNGPKGDAKGEPMPECVPTTDQRRAPGGLIFGSAAVPLAGATCAGCHSKYNGPLSIGFRSFDEFGASLTMEELTRISRNNDRNTTRTSESLLKNLLAEQNSCWSVDGVSAPAAFYGLGGSKANKLPGLADLVAKSPKFGQALGDQVPRLLANVTPDDNARASIAASFYLNGRTLKAAFRGFLTSESYKCEIKQ
jgi:hypothetical protein